MLHIHSLETYIYVIPAIDYDKILYVSFVQIVTKKYDGLIYNMIIYNIDIIYSHIDIIM